MTWTPDVAKTKYKCLYAATTDTFRSKLAGLSKAWRCCDDLDLDEFKEEINC